MSGGGQMYDPSGGSSMGGSNMGQGGTPFAAFNPQKSFQDPSQTGTAGGNMAPFYTHGVMNPFNPGNPMQGGSAGGNMAYAYNRGFPSQGLNGPKSFSPFDPSTGGMSNGPSSGFNPFAQRGFGPMNQPGNVGNQPDFGGNMSPPYGALVNPVNIPYMGMPQQPGPPGQPGAPGTPPAPGAPAPGGGDPTNPLLRGLGNPSFGGGIAPGANPFVQPQNADQKFLAQFNQNTGSQYNSMTQIPANDYTSYMQTHNMSNPATPSQGNTMAAGNPNPMAVPKSGQGPFATFAPPAYPTWLYGPTAGAFGGVSRPQGTPMNYGYFPGTGQWGAQPTGNNFNVG